MKNDKEKLSDILTAIFIKNNANTKLRDKLEADLENKFRSGKFNDIYNLRIQPKLLDEVELYLITEALFKNYELLKKTDKNTTRDKIDPINWFTDNEVTKANQIKIEYKSDEKVIFTLYNVDQIEEGIWVSSHETYKNLAENFQNGAIYYNYETQREGIIKTVLGEQIKVPKLNKQAVDEIYSAMKRNEYFLNALTFNIQETGDEKEYIKYYPKERKLEVEKSTNSMVAIVDGMHRLMAINQLISDYPDFEGYMIVRVFNLNTQKAQSAIVQESKNTPIDVETIRTFNVKDKWMQVAKKINEFESEETNEMYHKLTPIYDEVKSNFKYCLFSNIANGIEDNFKDILENSTARELDKVVRFLVAFYNEFIGMYENYFKDLENTKKHMVIADINIYTGILVIARKLYGVKGWQEILEDVFEEVIWDKSNMAWNQVYTNSLTWNKTTKTKVYSYFLSLMNEKVGVI